MDELNREAHRYLNAKSFEYRPVSVPLNLPVVRRISAVGAAEAALIPETAAFSDTDLRSYRKASNREREAKRRETVLIRIREKAARYPDDPFALYLLAEAEDAAGNYVAADTALTRLLALNPNHVRGLARTSLSMSRAAASMAGAARTAQAKAARQLAVRANRADPSDPVPLVAYFQTFRAGGDQPSPLALEGLMSAVDKLPENTRFRQMLAEELAAQKRWAAAIAALAPLANETHELPLRAAAREQIKAFEAELAKAQTTQPQGSD